MYEQLGRNTDWRVIMTNYVYMCVYTDIFSVISSQQISTKTLRVNKIAIKNIGVDFKQ